MAVAIQEPVTREIAWYNYDKLLSFNATFNFVVGPRGNGKTWGAKRGAIKSAIKTGEQFVYIRRYKEELKMSKDTFFADIAHVFPEWDFRTNGFQAEMAPTETRDQKKREWQVIGFFMPLSTAQSRKSVSYPKVSRIIFDEFIIEKGATRYLPNEAVIFQGLYSTIARMRENVRVFFLANSVSIMNPYFLYYRIQPDQVGEWHRSHPVTTENGGTRYFICCHFSDSEEFKSDVYRTAFGQFIQGTEYGDYAVDAGFADNHENMLGSKSEKARYYMTLETKAGIFSVWVDWNGPYFYVQAKRPKRESMYTIIPERMSEGKRLLTYSSKILQYLRSAFNNANVWFDSPQSRNAMIEIFKR